MTSNATLFGAAIAQQMAQESGQAAMMYGGLATSRLAVRTEAEAAAYTAKIMAGVEADGEPPSSGLQYCQCGEIIFVGQGCPKCKGKEE